MRKYTPVFAVLALIVALVGIKASQIGKLIAFGKAAAAAGPPPESVSTAIAQTQSWAGAVSSVGTVAAAKGVTVSSEAAGVVSAIHFESGAKVSQGQVILSLDSSVETAQLASLRARLELAEVNAKRTRALVQSGSIGQAQLDGDEAALKSATADMLALQAQIARKSVKAPFSGRLGIRMVNVGQYLNPGAPIATLESTDAVYVDFTLPQQRASEVKVGTAVGISVDAAKDIAGTVAAVDPTLDASTRSVKLRASFSKKNEALQPGMFVKVNVTLNTNGQVVSIPQTALVHASYGDSVFVVEEKAGADGKMQKVARQQFVSTGAMQGDFVAIEKGLKAGDEVVRAGAFKLRNNSSVTVHNELPSGASLTPQPENR